MTEKRKEYLKNWDKTHKERTRMRKLLWYYRNRVVINLMFSKPTSPEPDAADLYYAAKNPNG